MAQATINGVKLNAYVSIGPKEVIGKNDQIKQVNLVYFNCTQEAQRDEEGFFKTFQTHAIEGYGLIDQEQVIEVLKWSADQKEFDNLGNEFHHLALKMVEKAMKL